MKYKDRTELYRQSIGLLQNLIQHPSPSGRENVTAGLIERFLVKCGIEPHRRDNNVWATTRNFSRKNPTILLNSHHDTVKPNQSWTIDPYQPQTGSGKLYGLGSNDAGGALVSLLAAFRWFYYRTEPGLNLIYAATAEEETSGSKGIRSVITDIGNFDMAIVGEPTGMQMAVAEKGLMVLHCRAEGVAGHAARDKGKNAIHVAMDDIRWFRNFTFPRVSKYLGPVKMTVTGIQGGIQHNIIPDVCTYMVDIRTTDAYTHEEILQTIRKNIQARIERCSNDLNSSSISEDHLLVRAARKLGIDTFASPTLSDQALISQPSVKIGPGRSERSHTADEFIYLSEIEAGIDSYIQLLDEIARQHT
jgi:acetylornithine deacetylase